MRYKNGFRVETGSKEYVQNSISYYPWFRPGNERVELNFSGRSKCKDVSAVVDMSDGWMTDRRIGFSEKKNSYEYESNSVGYVSSLAWGRPTEVKFVRDGQVYEGRLTEIKIKPRHVRQYGLDCPSRGRSGARHSSLAEVSDISGEGRLDGREDTLVLQPEIVGVKADYIDGDRAVTPTIGSTPVIIKRVRDRDR